MEEVTIDSRRADTHLSFPAHTFIFLRLSVVRLHPDDRVSGTTDDLCQNERPCDVSIR